MDFETVFGFYEYVENNGYYFTGENFYNKQPLPIATEGYDYILYSSFEISLKSNTDSIGEFEIDGVKYNISVRSEDTSYYMLFNGNDELLSVSLTDIYNTVTDYPESYLSMDSVGLDSEKLTFDYKNDGINVRLIFNGLRIYSYGDSQQFSADVYILFTVK
jgi:hypothetical protein